MKKKRVKPTKALQEPGEKIVSFKERGKRSAAIQRRIAEAYPMVGGAGEDALWRSLTNNNIRDLNILTHRRMQDIAFYLYDSNPMAGRIIEIIEDFVIGDGFTYKANSPEVKEVLDKFWNDPDNNLDEEMNVNVVELFLFGELCLPVWVNHADGAVKLSYIDPKMILKITKDPFNSKISKKLFWKKPRGSKTRELDIINVDRKIKSNTYERLIGECFYFTINKVSSATRGRSCLLRLADWLDGYDQFLFARLERAFLLNNYIWDVECEGMTKGELEEFVKGLSQPKPGSIRAHNEKIKWKAETPKLESADASGEANLFKNQILGGAGFPGHWFAEGDKTTRATAMEMSLPTLKNLKSKQKKIQFMITRMFNFVIDQAIIAGTLKKDVDKNFKITPSPIVSRDNTKGTAQVINGLVSGLIQAADKEWITSDKAKIILNAVFSQLGVDIQNDVNEDKQGGGSNEK